MSCEIHIIDNYYLRSDPLQWMISKYKGLDKHGHKSFDNVSYHSQIHTAFDSLGKMLLRRANATTLTQLHETAESITTGMSGAYAEALQLEKTLKIEEVEDEQ